MSDITTRAYVWYQLQLNRLLEAGNDEGGLETVEYVAMTLVALTLLIAVAGVFKGDTSIGQAATGTMSKWIKSLAGN